MYLVHTVVLAIHCVLLPHTGSVINGPSTRDAKVGTIHYTFCVVVCNSDSFINRVQTRYATRFLYITCIEYAYICVTSKKKDYYSGIL
ncbi:hypothetical protein PF005_g14556 [Phytophthora fragariae]|uniref:Secreted protein n=1 Tax=Phytophthora fragariae TaxID=53985 RepID=A0A6A3RTE2_9STRA|nr:hypothetical protein PF003_g632 [Phytophthora fragariae]KAE8934111.1 hypothetical protein PF009_g15903 [Phytophthora fragariae]KAE9001938.1 hypothetical protein PF011_g13528 [Phytophthora fragariae]KAE9102346.1 hypothetical protein PF010_g14134 [Phytophthora fragariae]KAE9103621.1 hypothetical protein PF007_g14346 [Phytophthora fragariae]